MLDRIKRIDRRLAIAGTVMIASLALLGVGLVSVLVAVTDDNADLPSEGSIQEILQEHDRATPAEAGGQEEQPAGPAPTSLVIPNIGVDAPVLAMGYGADNYPQVPNAGDEVAWYTFSSTPGQGSNAVFSGHVDWYYWGQPAEGVFYHLRELSVGDRIVVKLEDGSKLEYRVTGNVATSYNDPDVVKVMDPTSHDVITLITCGGTWQRDYSDPTGGNYSHRVIVRAERVQDLASGQVSEAD